MRRHPRTCLPGSQRLKCFRDFRLKIVTISDVHGEYERFDPAAAPPGDLYAFGGDLTHYGLGNQSLFHVKTFAGGMQWLAALGKRAPVLAIPGNHDIRLSAETFNSVPNCRSINGERTVFAAGSADREWSLVGVSMSPCYDLPMLARIFDYSTIDVAEEAVAYDLPPADIMVSHCPPHGILDIAFDDQGQERHIGSKALLDYIERHKPVLVVCGHAHGNIGSKSVTHEASTTSTLVVNTAQTWGVWDSTTGIWERYP